VVWSTRTGSTGLGGVAATTDYVIYSERGLNNTMDVFRCLKADTGEELWAFRHPAPGELDYGSSPRTTPLIVGEHVYFYGAWGHLHCVELKTGVPIWQMDVRAEFNVEKLTWGHCGTPLLVDGKLIVAPGAPDASLVALEPLTGKVLWKTPGEPASYGSLIVATLGGKKQIVGHDATTLGGWDIATGKRLWTLKPRKEGDYNVPTPMVAGDRLVVTTENNGTRVYDFDVNGVIKPTPIAVSMELTPETHSPVIVGDFVFGIWTRMVCLDWKQGLKTRWTGEDDAFVMHTSIITDGQRLLVISSEGELILISATAEKFNILSRMKALQDEKGVYSHPALIGTRLYLRGSDRIVCIDLAK
jgi:outer membrane protein assembly factor BamB